MSHQGQLDFVSQVQNQFPEHFSSVKVLEVGSLNINGSVRQFFTGCDYTGIDVGVGQDVDLVVMGQDYDAPDGSFDTAITCECLEHNPEWVATFRNMIRMTMPGGLVVMTCAAPGRPEHGTSRFDSGCSPLTVALGWDYYRNLNEDDFRKHFDFGQLFARCQFCEMNCDLYFWGIKKIHFPLSVLFKSP